MSDYKITGSPEVIWLNYGDIERDDTHQNCARDGDVTWCEEVVFYSDIKYIRADAASRDAEVSELRNLPLVKLLKDSEHRSDQLSYQVTLLRTYLQTIANEARETAPLVAERFIERAEEIAQEALAATDHGSTHQDKAALFKTLGLVPWDNKPPACTDTVWIEPGRVATKESQGSNP